MDKKNHYKYLFIIGAAWNILISLSFILTSIFNLSAFPAYGITVPISMIWLQSFLFLFANLGIEYFFISLIYFIIGEIGLLTHLFAGVDIVFSILFIEFLLNYKKI